MKVMRKYYIGIQRNDEVIYVRDSVLLKSGPRRKDLPFVARVSGFWEEAEGEAIISQNYFPGKKISRQKYSVVRLAFKNLGSYRLRPCGN